MFTDIARCETVIIVQDVNNNKPELDRKNYQGIVVINQTIAGEHLLKVCILYLYLEFFYLCNNYVYLSILKNILKFLSFKNN